MEKLNDKERFIKPTNDNVPVKYNHDKHTRAETDAYFLIDKLGVNEDYRKFYLKVVYNLPETKWRELLLKAQQGDHPGRLFSFLAKRELDKIIRHRGDDNE